MPVDASIPLQVRGLELNSPLDRYAKFEGIKNAQSQNRLVDLAYGQKSKEIEQENLLAKLISANTNPDGSQNREGVFAGLKQLGRGDLIVQVQTGYSAQDKAKAEADIAAIDGLLKKTSAASQILSASTPENYPQIVQQVEQVMPGSSKNLPPAYDKGAIDAIILKGVPIKDQLEARRKELEAKISQDNTAWDRQYKLKTLDESKRRTDAIYSAGVSGNEPADLGVPRPTVNPWANQSNEKDANKVRAKEVERGSKEIEADNEAARKEAALAADVQRFVALNEKNDTGGVTDKFGPTRAVQGLGADYAEMESISARLIPAMRVPGSGSTSDFDAKMFERATVGVDKPKETNANIAQAIIARANRSQEYADFRRTYLEQNGTLQGADRYWKAYVNENPIFDPKSPGSFKLNAGAKSWKDHFSQSGVTSGNESAGTAPPGNSGGWSYRGVKQ